MDLFVNLNLKKKRNIPLFYVFTFKLLVMSFLGHDHEINLLLSWHSEQAEFQVVLEKKVLTSCDGQ